MDEALRLKLRECCIEKEDESHVKGLKALPLHFEKEGVFLQPIQSYSVDLQAKFMISSTEKRHCVISFDIKRLYSLLKRYSAAIGKKAPNTSFLASVLGLEFNFNGTLPFIHRLNTGRS